MFAMWIQMQAKVKIVVHLAILPRDIQETTSYVM
jgi:hypothetical protein